MHVAVYLLNKLTVGFEGDLVVIFCFKIPEAERMKLLIS